MVSESAHQSFGQDLIADFWELPLGGWKPRSIT
jgi:hypothetical protein